MTNKPAIKPEQIRLDKWLWCARFYKTRSLAINAIKGGKITVNKIKAKPAKLVGINDIIVIKRKPDSCIVKILDIPKTRKAAKDVVVLYEETPESIENRKILLEKIKYSSLQFNQAKGRPDKRNRRMLMKFKTSIFDGKS